VALGRFGTFTSVNEIRSATYPPIPPLDSWTFYHSSYSSRYLTFVSMNAAAGEHGGVPFTDFGGQAVFPVVSQS